MYKWMLRELHANIGLNMIDTNRFEEAIKHFDDLIKANPKEDYLYFWRGYAHRRIGISSSK